jgi:hypothetical protein
MLHLMMRPQAFEMRGTPGIEQEDAPRGFQFGLYRTSAIGGTAEV